MSNFTDGYALIIGVGVDLPMTVTDAKGINDILTDQGKAAYDPKNVILLTEDKADRNSILKAFEDLIKKSKQNPDATVVIYYSGHGGVKGNNYFLVPNGFNRNDLENTAISGKEFKEKVEKITSQKMLVLLDCCHAEGVVSKSDNTNISYKNKIFNNLFVNKTPEKLIETLGTGSGRVTIASSRADELSLAYKDDKYSVFTKHLIAALEGQGSNNSDGVIKLFSVLDYLFKKVPEQTNDRQNPIVSSIENLTENFPVCFYEGGTKSVSDNIAIQPVPANVQTIWGTIQDKDGKSLSGIEVRIREHEIKTETNRHGDFWLRNVPLEVTTFTASYHSKDTELQINPTRKYKISTNEVKYKSFVIIATIIALLIIVYLLIPPSKFSGNVHFSDNDEPVSLAVIEIPGFDKKIVTNERGYFEEDKLAQKLKNFTIEYGGERTPFTSENDNKKYIINRPTPIPTPNKSPIYKFSEEDFRLEKGCSKFKKDNDFAYLFVLKKQSILIDTNYENIKIKIRFNGRGEFTKAQLFQPYGKRTEIDSNNDINLWQWVVKPENNNIEINLCVGTKKGEPAPLISNWDAEYWFEDER